MHLRPSPERVESRALPSGLSPTDLEQYYLELLDDARFNPAAYGQSVGIDLSGVAPAQPLAMNTLLVESARLHSQDMIAQDYFSHDSPQGTDPAPDRRDGVRRHRLGREHRDQHQSRGGQPGFRRRLRRLGCRLQPQ